MSNRPYAIITARGGSKRIPKKNIRDFCGKPIISYSIETALESGLFDEVMVSTDSEEIADVSRQYGAKIPFMRSEAASNDFAGTEDVITEVIRMYEKKGITFPVFCCIYPTAPFITVQKLNESYELLKLDGVYSVIPVVGYSFPPQRGIRKKQDGFIEPVDENGMNSRTQDLEPIYHDCGQFYWFKTNEFMDGCRIFTNRTMPYFISETEAQDIDNDSDWKIAEMKYRLMRGLA